MRDEVSGRRVLFLMLALALIIVVFWNLSANRFKKTPVDAIADVGPQTLSQMLVSGKAGILEFYTNACPYCVRMESELARVSSTYGADLFVVKMNSEKHASEAAKYKVTAVPTLIYFDSSGKTLATAVGYRDFEQLVRDLKQLQLIP